MSGLKPSDYKSPTEIVETLYSDIDDRIRDYLLKYVKTSEDMIQFHNSDGRSIRNDYLLWDEKNPYTDDGVNHPDSVSHKILKMLWEKLKMANLYDKRRLPIQVGDIVKVYHYTSVVRREKCYMYKQAITTGLLADQETPYMAFSHLDMTDTDYILVLDDTILSDYEIVQSINDYYKKREKK